MTDDVAAYFDAVPERHRETVRAVRDLVLELHPDADERLKWNQPTYVVGGEDCFYVACYEEHVNLGFFQGTNLDDPDDLLDGTGKRMRHVSFRSADEVDDPAVRNLVSRAG